MGYNYSAGNLIGGSGQGKPDYSSESIYGRVVDVIMDSSHPKYAQYGKSQSLNGVFYRVLSRKQAENSELDLNFAFQGSASIRQVPLKGEIVKISAAPTEDKTRSDVSNIKKMYWTEIVSIWNHPHHNAYPDTLQFPDQQSQADLGQDFVESNKINPLQGFPGDLLFEGRLGQSIRFSGTKFSSNPWSTSSNNGQPFIVIKSGQKEGKNSMDPVVEDINKDLSSIYIMTDHKVSLKQANTKRAAWKSEPTKADTFQGSQIILNSGRLYFNARDESILCSSNEAFGANAKTVSLDGKDYVALDATKIYLGTQALKREQEPVLLGNTTINWLEDFLSQFKLLIDTTSTMPPEPYSAVALIVAISNAIKPMLPSLQARLKLLLSKKVYTE